MGTSTQKYARKKKLTEEQRRKREENLRKLTEITEKRKKNRVDEK